MPNLLTVLEEIEEDLTRILIDALDLEGFGPLMSVFIGAQEEGTTGRSLPYATIVLPGWTSTEDDDGVICSESAELNYEIYLTAPKNKGDRLEYEKRVRAQQIRTAIKTTTIRHTSLKLAMGDTYQESEDFAVQSTSDAYTIRLSYKLRVEWED